jgi:hypothetical protein
MLVHSLVMHALKSLLAGHGGEGERLNDERCCVVKLLPAECGGEGSAKTTRYLPHRQGASSALMLWGLSLQSYGFCRFEFFFICQAADKIAFYFH